MAKFCRNCGQPLEDGLCPYCDIPFETPEYSDTDYDYADDGYDYADGYGYDDGYGYGYYRENAFSGFGGVFRSGNVLKIIPFVGYAVMALIALLRFFLNFDGMDYDTHMTLLWISLISGIAVAVNAADLFRRGEKSTLSVVKAATAGTMGIFSIFCIIALLTDMSFTMDVSYGVYLVLLAAFWLLENNSARRTIYLVGLIVSVLNFASPLLIHSDIYWIGSVFYVVQLLCITFAYAFDNND